LEVVQVEEALRDNLCDKSPLYGIVQVENYVSQLITTAFAIRQLAE